MLTKEEALKLLENKTDFSLYKNSKFYYNIDHLKNMAGSWVDYFYSIIPERTSTKEWMGSSAYNFDDAKFMADFLREIGIKVILTIGLWNGQDRYYFNCSWEREEGK